MGQSGAIACCCLLAACSIETGGLKPSRTGTDGGAPETDGGSAPSDGGADAPSVRMDAGRAGCATADGDTVALWDFETGLPGDVIDSAGGHHGTLTAGASAIPGRCGTALGLDGETRPPPYGIVADSPDFDLAVGSVDFWMRYDGPLGDGRVRGIVSRDASGIERSGHFTISVDGDGGILLRLQHAEETLYRCSNAPIERSTWTHVGIVFGAPRVEMFVDGERATRSEVTSYTGGQPCDRGEAGHIAGNDNPLVLGAAIWHATEGTGDNVDDHLAPAALDHVRISSIRRDFAR